MTICVFDGKTLVTDGKTSFVSKSIPRTTDINNKNKITLLEKPWQWAKDSDVFVTALTACGISDHSTALIMEIQRAVAAGEYAYECRQRVFAMFGGVFETQIAGVGYRGPEDNRKTTSIGFYYQSDTFDGGAEEWNRDAWLAGELLAIGSPDVIAKRLPKLRGFTALDAVSAVCLLAPEKCGGLLTRYDPLTGKLDHPAHASKERIRKYLGAVINKQQEELTSRAKKFELVTA